MTATHVPPPPFNAPFLDGRFISNAWQLFLTALYNTVGGAAGDKVDAAHTTAFAAAPKATEIVAIGGLHGGSTLDGNVGIALYKVVTAVASLPSVGNTEGDWAYALDGRKPGEGGGAGTGVPVFRSNGAWVAVTSGATVTA